MRQSAPAPLGGCPADLERAEIAGEVAQLRVVELLVAKHQHGVAVDRRPNRVDRCSIDGLGEVYATDFGGEVRIDPPYLDGHSTSSISPGEGPPAYDASQSLEARPDPSRSRA